MSKKHRAPMAKGYSEAGASTTRRALKGFAPESSSPNEDVIRNNDILRKRSRLLYMSTPVATSAINTNRSKVVGVGLGLKPTINREILGLSPEAAKKWQRRTEAEFAMWANKARNCDAIGLNNFADLQQLALKSWLMSGDCFVLMKRRNPTASNPYSLRLQIVEADRVCTPYTYAGAWRSGLLEYQIPEGKEGAGNSVFDGVEINKDGMVVAYYVASRYPEEIRPKDVEWQRVIAYGEKTGLANILHIMDSERPDQYRGVPYLAQIIEPLLQIRRYTESELMAALVQSFFTAWIQTETSPLEIPTNEVGQGDTGGANTGEGDEGISGSENEYEMGPGTVLHLQENEKVNFGNPNIPTAGFEAFMKTMLRMMGAALEIPYDVLVKEYNSSYSSARAAMQDAWEAFRTRRKWFVDDMCQPVYETWLAEAVALGRIKAPGFFDDPLLRAAWCGARWIGPAQGILDPLKEARAAIMLIDRGIKTHAQVTMEMTGGDWEENVEQLAKENELLKRAGGGTISAMSTGGGEGE